MGRGDPANVARARRTRRGQRLRGAQLGAARGGRRGEAGSGLIGSVAPTVCGMHMGQAAGQAALEAFGGTDLGIPLARGAARGARAERASRSSPRDSTLTRTRCARSSRLREAAHVRLFQRGAVACRASCTPRSSGMRAASPSTSTRSTVRWPTPGLGDPAALQQALTRGIFASHHTDEQAATLEQIETWLALIEGWVDEVTMNAAAPHLPSIGALREMMRRRRAAGGPAEDAFSNLLGPRPAPAPPARRVRDVGSPHAHALARTSATRSGRTPTCPRDPEQLADWQAWIDARSAGADDIDAGLAHARRQTARAPTATTDATGLIATRRAAIGANLCVSPV